MATAAEPSKTVATPKYEAFVEGQLSRARRRIRILDMAAAGLGLLVLILLYALAMAVLDYWLTLSLAVRQLALLGLVALMIAYVAVTLIRPLSRQVNPYYAARQVEQTLPGAKNSLVNWLDLRLQKLSPAIRQAVGHRAAHDLTQADLDTAINGRRVAWLGGIAGLLFLAAVILLCILHFDPFRSLMGRAFAPFGDASKAHRTRITIIQPDGGDATVPVNQSVSITVHVDGVVPEPNKPDALKLLFRHNQNDPAYEELRLERGDHGREWTARVPAFQVHDGFWYKVTGGDDETAEHRIQPRSAPLLTSFDITHHFRPYLRRPDVITTDPNLQGLRGTEITILAHTNRKVKDGRLVLEGANQSMPAELTADQPDALKFRLVLEKSGSYRIRFTSVEGEENGDPIPYTIQVEQDHVPQVVLTKPGKNIELPADGVLSVEGKAEDDYGLASVTLKMQVGKQELAGKLYRGKEWWDRFKDAFLPQSLEYKDFVELDKVQSKTGQPFMLQPGTELEYWLEAADACDYPPPGPQVGRSERFKVRILPPRNKPKEKQQEKEKAQQEQKQHEQKQDQQLDKQQEARNEAHKQPETKPQDPKEKEQEKKDQELKKQAEQLQKNIDKQQKEQPGQKENKPPDKNGKPDNQKPKNSGSEETQAEKRPPPKQDGNQNKGEGKPDPGSKPAEKKPNAKPQQGGGQQGEKKSEPKQDPGEGKRGGKPEPAPDKGDKKPDGQPEKDGQPGEKKPQPASPQADNKSTGEQKPQPQPNNSPDDNKAAGKPEPSKQDPKQPPGQGKPEGQPEGSPSQGESKGGGNNPGGGTTPKEGQSPGASKEQTPAGESKKNDNQNGGTAGQPQPGEPKKEGQQSQGGGEPKDDKKTDGQQQSGDSPKPGQPKGDNEKPATPSPSDAAQPGTPKNGPDGKAQQSPGDGKKEGTETKTDKGDGKGQGKKEQGEGASGEPKKQPDKKGEQAGEAKTPAKDQKDNGTQPGIPGSGNRTGEAAGSPSPEEGDPANPAHRKKAFELQLEDLKKKLTPDMLKKLNMTEKERDEFLKACEEALKRMPSEKPKKETLPGAQTGRGGTNTGPRRIDPKTKGPRDDLENAGPTAAPPEYRSAYKDFSEEIAKRKKDREKK